MPVRAIYFAIVIIVAMTLSPNARADDGLTTTAVNMRTCGSVRCPVIQTVPARAKVGVDHCNSWCSASYAGRSGYMYGRYIEFSGPAYIVLRGPVLTPRIAPLRGGPLGISQSSGSPVLAGPILTPRIAPLHGGPLGISQSSGYLMWPGSS